MDVTRINPVGLSSPIGYTQVIRMSNLYEMYFVSGQLPIDTNGKLISGSFAEQAVQAFKNVQRALSSADLTFDDVVKLNIFLTDMSNLPELQKTRATFLKGGKEPAITTVESPKLAIEGCLLEIEAIAAK
jgi:2-iminobutanoate/2-iminopropanoate deaminase